MLVGDFLDAVGGYNEGESERIKSIAEIVRMSTTILMNIQLSKEDRITPHELWPFTWDKISVDEKQKYYQKKRSAGEKKQWKVF